MSSKTSGFVVNRWRLPKADKRGENALILATKLRCPFCEQGVYFGRQKPDAPIFFWQAHAPTKWQFILGNGFGGCHRCTTFKTI